MATSNQDPEFYQNYTSAEVEKFESILRLIHSPEPNVALAKKKVSEFSDNKELERFKGFKKEFESALQKSAQKIEEYSQQQDSLKQREVELGEQKRMLVHSKVQQVGKDLGKRSVTSPTHSDDSANKKRKR